MNPSATIIPPEEMPPLEPASPASVSHVPPGPLLSLRRIDEAIGVLCMAGVVLSITWGVITRYMFPQPAANPLTVPMILLLNMVLIQYWHDTNVAREKPIRNLTTM